MTKQQVQEVRRKLASAASCENKSNWLGVSLKEILDALDAESGRADEAEIQLAVDGERWAAAKRRADSIISRLHAGQNVDAGGLVG